MKILIVDDELLARRIIRKIISEHFPTFEFTREASNLNEAITIIKEDKPDLIFLDIQLKDKNSFEIFEQLDHNELNIIFVTAYEQYGIKAFEVGAKHYILKPIEEEKLIDATEKVMRIMQNKNVELGKISIPYNSDYKILETQKIIFAQADGAYCKIFMKDNAEEYLSKPLNYIEEKLKNFSSFFRIHKSFLVNGDFIESIARDKSSLLLTSGETLPIARSRRDDFKAFISEYF
ncbi:two component transcriptional regulator, LytTR family [Lishizhenia tianjinensis]|uniref:Two component transcriptional regulator, LytTR family n=1 Tax=Lishizhenia tianjinensis TaxID=477690 RepID=A0A1I6YLB0_9FLAO|nr:LytTR family DNA-binding domain-containing protein [Lishizhenia tianjinensis]SFT51270.1 two component transcriptional regulator, LytTR family [Lishizhenia tianjinensis]